MEDDGRGKNGFFARLSHKNNEDQVLEEELEGEITSILEEGQDQGIIKENEAEMITNIFQLDDIDADEIMTHRTNIVGVDCNWTLEETIDFITEESFSRYPVYENNIDNITGILHIKDFLYYYKDPLNRGKKLYEAEGLLAKPVYVPETSKIDNIFKNMQANKVHMVIVVDEYGQTAGLVAMEDILEEIVGNIFDEHDEIEYNIIKTGTSVYNIKGLTPLEEITRECGVEFPEDDYDTLNGYLISKLDRIPEDDIGTEVVEDGVKFKILSIDDKTISVVRMEIVSENKEGQVE